MPQLGAQFPNGGVSLTAEQLQILQHRQQQMFQAQQAQAHMRANSASNSVNGGEENG